MYICPMCFLQTAAINSEYPICSDCDSEGCGIEFITVTQFLKYFDFSAARAGIKKSRFYKSYRDKLLERLENVEKLQQKT